MKFDPLSEQYYEDPTEMFRWLREEAPLFHSDDPDYWAVSRYDDVHKGYMDWRNLSNQWGVGLEDLEGVDVQYSAGNILSMDPPEHDRLRALLNRSFTPKAVKAYEPLVRQVITSALDELSEREEFDVVQDFSALFPVEVISALLGVPPKDRQQVRIWTAQRLARDPGESTPGEKAQQAFLSLVEYFGELVAERRKSPTDDMISRLCQAEVTLDDGTVTQLGNDEIVGFSRLLGSAGSETVTKLVGNGIVLFHRNRDQWQKVLDDASLAQGAVEETVRYYPPVTYSGRRSMNPVEFGTGTVPAGARVVLVTGAATRDPRRFENPDEFEIEREQHMQLGFGFGIHTCIGAHLARLESRIAFEEFAHRWPDFELDEGGLRKVHMTNVSGFENVPLAVRPTATSTL